MEFLRRWPKGRYHNFKCTFISQFGVAVFKELFISSTIFEANSKSLIEELFLKLFQRTPSLFSERLYLLSKPFMSTVSNATRISPALFLSVPLFRV